MAAPVIVRDADTDDDGSSTTGTIHNNAWKTAIYNRIDTLAAALFGVAGGGTGVSTLTAHGVVIGNGTSAAAVTSAGLAGQVLTSNGASADPTFRGGAVQLNRNITSQGNTGTAETELMAYTLPAAMLAVDKDSVHVHAWGIGAANTNTKTLRLYFGSTVVATIVMTNASYTAWQLTAMITRTGAATQIALGVADVHIYGGLSITYTTPGETLSGTVIIKLTGQSGTGSNDVTGKSMATRLETAA